MISAVLLTQNSARILREVLASLSYFEEVILYDSGSQDKTLEIAKQFPNIVIVKGEFRGFGPTRNVATDFAKNDWILSIDSDEIVSKEMAQEIVNISLKEECVYSFPRHNYFNGKWIKWCGWYPDRLSRLYHRKKTHFTNALVHESIITTGMQKVDLKAPLRHYPYASIANFLEKMQLYSTLFALDNQGKKSSSLGKAFFHGAAAFLKSYFLKRGFLGGFEGFVISLYNCHTAYYKYLKLYEINRQAHQSQDTIN